MQNGQRLFFVHSLIQSLSIQVARGGKSGEDGISQLGVVTVSLDLGT